MDDTKAYVYDFDRLDLGQMEEIEVHTERREGENTFLRYSGISNKNSTVPLTKTRLKASNMYISDIMDKFGNNVSISPAGHTFFIAAINEEPTPEMYIWTREFSPPIEIVFPENAEAELRAYFASLSKDDDPDIQLTKEAFQNMENFLSTLE